jgi:hypothetical protein
VVLNRDCEAQIQFMVSALEEDSDGIEYQFGDILSLEALHWQFHGGDTSKVELSMEPYWAKIRLFLETSIADMVTSELSMRAYGGTRLNDTNGAAYQREYSRLLMEKYQSCLDIGTFKLPLQLYFLSKLSDCVWEQLLSKVFSRGRDTIETLAGRYRVPEAMREELTCISSGNVWMHAIAHINSVGGNVPTLAAIQELRSWLAKLEKLTPSGSFLCPLSAKVEAFCGTDMLQIPATSAYKLELELKERYESETPFVIEVETGSLCLSSLKPECFRLFASKLFNRHGGSHSIHWTSADAVHVSLNVRSFQHYIQF